MALQHKKEDIMSDEAAEEIMKKWDEWKEEDALKRFQHRMQHKLHAKERGKRW